MKKGIILVKEGSGWPDKYKIEGTKFCDEKLVSCTEEDKYHHKLQGWNCGRWWTPTSCKQAWTFATNEHACTPKMEGLD